MDTEWLGHVADMCMKESLKTIEKQIADRLYSNIPLMIMVVVMNVAYPFIEFTRDGSVVLPYGIGLLGASIVKATWIAIVSALIVGRSPWLKWIVFLIHWFVFEIWFYLGIQFQARITPFVMLLVLQTNADEAVEFFNSYFPMSTLIKLALGGGGTILLFSFIDFLWNRIEKKHWRIMQWILVMSIALFPCSLIAFFQSKQVFIQDGGFKEKVLRVLYSSNLPINDICLSFKTVNDDKKGILQIEHANADIRVDTCFFSSPNIVLVIGESFIKGHSSLYGYRHDTNPCLSREAESGNLFVFHDVVSHSAATAECMKYFYSVSGVENKDWMSRPLFPAYFKMAGYCVKLFDNQNSRTCGSVAFDYGASFFIAPQNIHNQCFDYRNERIYEFDHEMLEAESDHLNNTDRPGLTIFHLMGQHVDFKARYPKTDEFMYFSTDSVRRHTSLSYGQCEDIMAYDNATRYNDKVIGKIIDNYKNTDAIVIYISDHGECVFDDSKLTYGRPIAEDKSLDIIKLLYEVPMVVWCSDDYIKNHPEVVARIAHSTERPFMHDHMSHLLFDLAGICCTDFIPEYSVISEDYIPVVRMVNGGRFNYDANRDSLANLYLRTIEN